MTKLIPFLSSRWDKFSFEQTTLLADGVFPQPPSTIRSCLVLEALNKIWSSSIYGCWEISKMVIKFRSNWKVSLSEDQKLSPDWELASSYLGVDEILFFKLNLGNKLAEFHHFLPKACPSIAPPCGRAGFFLRAKFQIETSYSQQIDFYVGI